MASSDAARTSRASAPMATPSAPKASEPTASASSHSPTRLQSSGTNALTPASNANETTRPQAAASRPFSASSTSRETSPRTSRASACSSRSSASAPAASRAHTNIIEMLTATTTAKVSSGVLRLHERLHERVAVEQQFEFGLREPRFQPRSDVPRDHHRSEHLRGFDLFDRLRARAHAHGLDLAEQMLRVIVHADVLAADFHGL